MDTPPTSDTAAMDSPTEAVAVSAQLISASNSRVNVHCNACQTYLGIFENEWIRLTSSYARPTQQGIHHGTDISEKTRIVPTGTGQRAAEGCTLSDVICQKCSATVGQYCKEAPTVEQHHLEDAYFYKLSRVTLKDFNLELVDPIFAYSEEMTPDMPGSPVPSVVAPDPKWSHPPIKSHLRNVYHSDGLMPPPPRSSRTPAVVRTSHTPRLSSRPQSHIARRTSSIRDSSVASQRRTQSLRPVNPEETPEGLLALRRVIQQDVAVEKMATMMESLIKEVRELRQAAAPPQKKSTALKRSKSEDKELQALRAENHALKKVIKTLPPQTQFENPRHSQSYDDAFDTPESDFTNALGKRKRDSDIASDSLLYQEDDAFASVYDDYDEPMHEVSGLATLEQDAAQGYSVWRGEEEGSEGDNYSEEDADPNKERPNQDNRPSESPGEDRALSDTATGERHSARSRERRQTLPADFIAEEQRYLLSDSNDENFDPNDPKVKGRKHKRTRSAERRRRERLERQQDSLWKKGVPGGGYENGDGWVEQKRHHSGRFGRKAAVGEGLAVYPKYVNDKLFANGRQIPTTHKRLARELVYLGLDDWIDKDKSDPLYRRTIRVARKHYAYHHGGISSKALCQGKYTKKDLEAVGMWDDELFEEINMGEESDVEKLDFPLDPALQISIARWKDEGAKAKERKRKAAQEAAAEMAAEEGEQSKNHETTGTDADGNEATRTIEIFDLTGTTQFSDEDGDTQESSQQSVPQVPDRVEMHKKFNSIWQAQVPTSNNSVLAMMQHAEARIKAAEEEMGEPTFKSKRAQKFKTIGQSSDAFSAILAQVPKDAYITPANNKSAKQGKRRKALSADTIRVSTKEKPQGGPSRSFDATARKRKAEEAGTPAAYHRTVKRIGLKGVRTVAEHLDMLGMPSGTKESNSFLRELRAYSAINKDTGAHLSAQEHIALTDDQLMDYAESFLETNVVMVGGSRKIGLEFWPDDSLTKLSYVTDKEEIKMHVYDIFVIQRLNKARRVREQLNKAVGGNLSTAQLLDPNFTLPTSMSSSPQSAANLALQAGLFDRPFDNGLRFEVKPGFRGNKYYWPDGAPRTAEDAARLERKAKYKASRNSLPVSGISDEALLEKHQARRRATMANVSSSALAATDSSLMTPFIREASVLEDSVLQMASAMRQLTKAFDDTVDTSVADSDAMDDDQDIAETMDVDITTVASVTNTEMRNVQAEPVLDASNAPNPPISIPTSFVRPKPNWETSEPFVTPRPKALAVAARDSKRATGALPAAVDTSNSQGAQSNIITIGSDAEDRPASTGDNIPREEARLVPEEVEPANETAPAPAPEAGTNKVKSTSVLQKGALPPPLLTRSAARASNSAETMVKLIEKRKGQRQPVVETMSRHSPTSTSDKENATPVPDPETALMSTSGDPEPPLKKAKTTLKRGSGRTPRKSAAELDQMAKEAMERETRSSGGKSGSGMYFGSRYSL